MQWIRLTRNRAVARIDSGPCCLTTPLGSRDVIGHVTIW